MLSVFALWFLGMIPLFFLPGCFCCGTSTPPPPTGCGACYQDLPWPETLYADIYDTRKTDGSQIGCWPDEVVELTWGSGGPGGGEEGVGGKWSGVSACGVGVYFQVVIDNSASPCTAFGYLWTDSYYLAIPDTPSLVAPFGRFNINSAAFNGLCSSNGTAVRMCPTEDEVLLLEFHLAFGRTSLSSIDFGTAGPCDCVWDEISEEFGISKFCGRVDITE